MSELSEGIARVFGVPPELVAGEWTAEQALRAIARRVGLDPSSPPKRIAAEVDAMLSVYEDATEVDPIE